jgi:peptide-methionine (S)-S-oxide reductase
MTTEFATFGAGCFWGIEATYRTIDGVVDTSVGFMGGHVENASYRDVCTGTTGHAEVVHIEYDPEKAPYELLLEIFWRNHDPTTRDRQGPDVGSQYRSAIFFHSTEQESTAIASKEAHDKSGKYPGPIVTEITAASKLLLAEEYHQQYLEKRGLATCTIK